MAQLAKGHYEATTMGGVAGASLNLSRCFTSDIEIAVRNEADQEI
ncbi:hypothetical protein GCM10028825_54420 [Spirosoma agri]